MCPDVGQMEGDPLAAADLFESELIYSSFDMSMPSDADGPCAASVDPDPPAGSISVAVPVTVTSIILNLQPGQTYYARIRVSAYLDSNWSSWSNQVEFTVPYGRPNVIRLAGFLQLQYEEIGVTQLLLGKRGTGL